MLERNEPIVVGGSVIQAGEKKHVELSVARLPTSTQVSIPVMVLHGRSAGPRLWLSAAIHGDELNGVEIIRRVIEKVRVDRLAGTVLAVPIVNVFGFIEQSRYLPDRRDLNRSFPGSRRGSLASRIAHLFMAEVVSNCTHGIDLHTASHHRTNLPQIRADLEDAETRRCAKAFGAPVALHARTRDGSLRAAAAARGVSVLLYEAGEAMRFNPRSIAIGVKGVLQVMSCLNMRRRSKTPQATTLITKRTEWLRAKRGGILRLLVECGDQVSKGECVAWIADAFGEDAIELRAQNAGLVIGRSKNPVVHQGDAVVHVATG